MKKIKPIAKKHRFLRWIKKLLGIQSPSMAICGIDEMHELTDKEIERAILQASSKKVGRITLGVGVKRCDKCDRGDCTSCDYKREFERLMALPNCNDCCERVRNGCQCAPRIGEFVRINCPMWVPEEGKEVEG